MLYVHWHVCYSGFHLFMTHIFLLLPGVLVQLQLWILYCSRQYLLHQESPLLWPHHPSVRVLLPAIPDAMSRPFHSLYFPRQLLICVSSPASAWDHHVGDLNSHSYFARCTQVLLSPRTTPYFSHSLSLVLSVLHALVIVHVLLPLLFSLLFILQTHFTNPLSKYLFIE